jgi:hypothetical protein
VRAHIRGDITERVTVFFGDCVGLRDTFRHHYASRSVVEAYSSDRPPLQQRVLDVMSPQAQAGYLSQRVLRPVSRSLKKGMEMEYSIRESWLNSFSWTGPHWHRGML